MAKLITAEAIILKTHDVGEADRFCILLTKEYGKITARARGVRKPKSRMGGSILPLHHIEVTLRESSSGYHIQEASRSMNGCSPIGITAFLRAQQGIEILLALLHDQDPLPDVFQALALFLRACDEKKDNPVLPFTLRLLHLVGLLPDPNEHEIFIDFSQQEKQYILDSIREEWTILPNLTSEQKEQFSILCARLLATHIQKPLKAGSMFSEIVLNNTQAIHTANSTQVCDRG